jgi:hypothetical protein
MPPTARTTRARAATRVKPTTSRSGQPPVKQWEPVRIVTNADAPILDREPLFYIDDEEFTIPKVVPPNITYGYIRDMRGGNTEQAMANVFDRLLGQEALDRLADCDQLTPEQSKEIMRVIEYKVMAVAEELQGN